MPARKPSGIVVRNATEITIGQSHRGSQPASARIPSTSASPTPRPSGVAQRTRSHPARVNRRHPVAGGTGVGWTSWSCSIVVISGCPLLRSLDEILHEGVQLLLGELVVR